MAETWCPSCRAGSCGVHVAARFVREDEPERCYFCKRLTEGDATTVDFGHVIGLVAVCGVCEDKRDNEDERYDDDD